MKLNKIILIFLVLLFITVPCYPKDQSETRLESYRMYDKKGSYTGKGIATSYGQVRLYDTKGRYTGKKVYTNYGQVRLYDKKGNYVGKEK